MSHAVPPGRCVEPDITWPGISDTWSGISETVSLHVRRYLQPQCSYATPPKQSISLQSRPTVLVKCLLLHQMERMWYNGITRRSGQLRPALEQLDHGWRETMNNTVRHIWIQRQQERNPAKAFDTALEYLKNCSSPLDVRSFNECWYEHFAGSKCLLLQFARAMWSKQEGARLVRLFRLQMLANQSEGLLQATQPFLLHRIELLRNLNSRNLTVEQLTQALHKAASFYADYFAANDESVQTPAVENSPAFLGRLSSHEKWRGVLHRLAEELGWRNPGLLMVGETIAYVYGADDPEPDEHDIFKTWVLLAGRNTKSPTGMLAQLRLRRCKGGCGGFFPDPVSAGYTRLEDDFKSALSRAWRAAFGTYKLDFDVAWSLQLIDADAGLRSLPIGGRSAEGAICCALRALAADQRLDQRVAVSARLEEAHDGCVKLLDVAAINDKMLAEPLIRNKITEIVVAENQIEILRNDGQDVKVGNGKISLVPAADVDQAYQRLVRWERITNHVRKKMAEAAERLIEELCGHYVVPSLSQPTLQRSDGHRAAMESFEPLSKEKVSELLDGRLEPHARFLLLAQSGMGKSLLLIESQRRMAKQPDGPLPVRLVRLSEFPWSDPANARRRMADSLARFLPEDVSERDRWEWFDQLVASGQAVFLLDALDQTLVNELKGMANFLAANLADCPVLMTGRPYVTETRREVVTIDPTSMDRSHRSWTHIRLDGFNEWQQREFLGEWADYLLSGAPSEFFTDTWDVDPSVLLTQGELVGFDREYWESEVRPAWLKRQWYNLVDQPLLLKMLRDLATAGTLWDIKNRHSVYQAALQALIDKGWDSLKASESKPIFDSRNRVQRVLRQIAWSRAVAGDFQGTLSGDALDDLMTHLARGLTNTRELELRGALDQMNIVTCAGIVQAEQGDRLEWRHLSFFEYFAGLELAQGYPRQRMMQPPGGETYDRHAANEYAAAVTTNARDQRWNSIFRFALSQLAASDKVEDQERLAALTADMIQFGNPFVIVEAIGKDRVELPKSLDRLSRWLVHRGHPGGWSDAWECTWPKPDVDTETLELLESAFVRGRRDSRYLHAAWELVSQSDLELALSIRKRFLGEFPKLLASGNPVAVAIRDGFQEIPPIGDPLRETMRFAIGMSDEERPQSSTGLGMTSSAANRRYVSLSAPFEIARTPVTNVQFELFALEHREPQWPYTLGEDTRFADCPVMDVTWFEAQLYCIWLGTFGGGQPCRLPTEIEWEIACRAGSEGPYCRIRELDGTVRDLAPTEDDLRRVARLRSYRSEPVAGRLPNIWGLHDMLCNDGEWCVDSYGDGSYRGVRGAAPASRLLPDDTAPPAPWSFDYDGFFRPWCREDLNPEQHTGFRVARSCVITTDTQTSRSSTRSPDATIHEEVGGVTDFREYIPGLLWQTGRPGYPRKHVEIGLLEQWLVQVRARQIITIICLLDDAHLAYYASILPDGLLGAYRQAGFAVIHRPVRDHQWPYVSDETLALVFSDVLNAAAPILVHCSAGMERSPAVCEYLVEQSVKEFGERVTECMERYSNGRGMAHFRQVTHLAIQLYDLLEEYHRLPSRFRTVLWAGAMLHDIGTDERLANMPGEHGWRSADFIRQSPERFVCNLASSDEIAVLAALHSADGAGDDPVLGEVPDWLAETFGELPQELRWLVAILRVADGLDRGLDQTVAGITAADVTNHQILVRGKPSEEITGNINRANQKGALLRALLNDPQLAICQESTGTD